MIACGDDEPTGPTGDTTPPTIVLTVPSNGADNVSVDSSVVAVFSEPIDSNSVTAASFAFSGGVDGDLDFSGDSVIFTADNSLAYSTSYTATISTAVTDRAGNHLASAYSWSFTTEGDPATTPPTIISTVPTDGAIGYAADLPVTATFNKAIDPATLTDASFYLDNGATGSVSYSNWVATFTPDDTLEFNTLYTATITTAVADTFGNNLAAEQDWSFTTGDNPLIPQASMFWPYDSAIVGDTVTIQVDVVHPFGADSVQYFIDGALVSTETDNSEPFQYLWNLTSEEIGSSHTLYGKAYEASGFVGYSDTITVIYLWQELAADINDYWRTDIKRVLYRSTNSLLELRYEFWESWFDPYDTIPDDTTLDLGIYFDTDRNSATGRRTFNLDRDTINDIGAEYRIIMGLHGSDTALAIWSVDPEGWQPIYDTSGHPYYRLMPFDTILEFGVRWTDLGSPGAINIVSINFFFVDFETTHKDWVPDHNNGHLSVWRNSRYIGEGYTGSSAPFIGAPQPAVIYRENPFDAD